MKIVHTIYLFFCYASFFVSATDDHGTYNTENRVFHIERSKNKNIVCYDFNLDNIGKLNETEPLLVYWINREDHPGQHGTLSFIQRKLAFGYSVVGKINETIVIELNAIRNRKLTIERNELKYFCQTDINKQPSTLYKIYVKTKESNSLQVEYVDIFGYNHATGLMSTERIIP